jgi:hypothetical protein
VPIERDSHQKIVAKMLAREKAKAKEQEEKRHKERRRRTRRRRKIKSARLEPYTNNCTSKCSTTQAKSKS